VNTSWTVHNCLNRLCAALPRSARLLFFVICTLSCLPIRSQDLHNSQFIHNLTHLTPAATGVFQGEIKASILYKNQWQRVPVAFNTFSGNLEWKALEQKSNLLSLGLTIQKDRAGDGGLSWLQLGTTVAVAHQLNLSHFLSAGFGLYLVQRSLESKQLTFKNQWNGTYFDPDLLSGEPIKPNSGLKPSLAGGLYWHHQNQHNRNQFDAGVGLSHLNKPLVSLGDFSERLNRRISFLLINKIQINNNTDWVLLGKYDQLGKSEETLVGTGFSYILSTGIANETSFQSTISYRFRDAIVPAIQFERNNWLASLSYDLNISRFNRATNRQGGIEIAVVWKKIAVKSAADIKSCPVF
jgi:type IX secretion system PorP/SprF family membrane protein